MASKQLEKINWGYDEESQCKPEDWPQFYSVGKHQSPINILVGCCDPSQLNGTCCKYSPIDADLTAQVMSDLRVSATKAYDNLQNDGNKRPHHRHHLNSTGEDSNHRSASNSSVSSGSNCVSPLRLAQRGEENFYDESDDDDNDNEDNLIDANGNFERRRRRQLAAKSNSKLDQQQQQQQQNTRHCVTNKKIFLGYPRYLSSMQLSNTGHNWQVDFPQEIGANTLIRGPPFGDREYKLAQFHCHWGDDCSQGSEHLINGKGFAAEDMQEASRHKHGLAVLGVLVQAFEGEQHRNKQFDKIIASGLAHIEQPNTSVEIHPRLDLKKLFPSNRWPYASYEGSLTTPPLSEVVDWVVFLSPITCSTSQIAQFRRLKCPSGNSKGHNNKPLIRNCRPVQPSNGRVVSIWTHH